MSFHAVENELEIWGYGTGIIPNGKIMGQAIKTLEETTELLDAINRNNDDEIDDAIGDIGTTLIMICAIRGIPFTKCLEKAKNVVVKRKGYLRPDGVFVKES
jgi:hypothetical protein